MNIKSHKLLIILFVLFITLSSVYINTVEAQTETFNIQDTQNSLYANYQPTITYNTKNISNETHIENNKIIENLRLKTEELITKSYYLKYMNKISTEQLDIYIAELKNISSNDLKSLNIITNSNEFNSKISILKNQLQKIELFFNSISNTKEISNSNNSTNKNIQINLTNQESNNYSTEYNYVPHSTKSYNFNKLGTIQIPKTNVNLPIADEITGESLEVATAFLYGTGLNNIGNTTIIGHNYKNGKLFSNNKYLTNGDYIYITDQSGTTIQYQIYNTFETTPEDVKYLQRDTQNSREISLSCCTDNETMRLIILAREI